MEPKNYWYVPQGFGSKRNSSNPKQEKEREKVANVPNEQSGSAISAKIEAGGMRRARDFCWGGVLLPRKWAEAVGGV
jgi:hypothetical protein